jgi:hypothetical protein
MQRKRIEKSILFLVLLYKNENSNLVISPIDKNPKVWYNCGGPLLSEPGRIPTIPIGIEKFNVNAGGEPGGRNSHYSDRITLVSPAICTKGTLNICASCTLTLPHLLWYNKYVEKVKNHSKK